ncbi:hypothetical protein Naga_100279g8 [Nannochloropsis gaditana]|uniref:Uncharacterized protein n=1 Tax=Nannochloropsis gaditana TaxID=72520 RepID=W7TQB4_9STRA|nr:hypothetical protein Naga_100279g8 [Nannochloropsis gaditana]
MEGGREGGREGESAWLAGRRGTLYIGKAYKVEWTWESEEQKCQKDLGTGFRSSWGHFTGYPGSFLSPPSPHKERHDARRGRESHARMLCRVGGRMQTPCALLSFESHPCLTPGVHIREAAPILAGVFAKCKDVAQELKTKMNMTTRLQAGLPGGVKASPAL